MKHLRILFLADINSPHTQKWASSMASKGFEIGIFSLNKSNKTWFSAAPNVTCLHKPLSKSKLGVFKKLCYLFALPKLLYILYKFKPSIVHAHYATSYGLLGALTTFSPLIVSVWGGRCFRIS